MNRALQLNGIFAVILAALGARSMAMAAATVTTLAGSGLPGIDDGPSATARFLMPTAIAYLSNGNLLVLDTAAQRVREVSSAGFVRTLAGAGPVDSRSLSVAGGYRDGEARLARFNWPLGLAVGPDGTVYVADTGNRAIRAIKNGTVRTVLGGPAHHRLSLPKPVGIAVDSTGAIYVADPDAGLTRISALGTEMSLLGLRAPFGIASFETHHGQYLYGVDADGILERRPNEATDWRLRSFNQRARDADSTENRARHTAERRLYNETPVGYPVMVTVTAQLGNPYLFYADVRTNTIRFLSPEAGMMRVLAGRQTEDASGNTGGFADGEGDGARFNAPTGTSSREIGELAIADTGNRRIRLLRYDPGAVFYDDSDQEQHDNDYRIAYMGNSFVQFDAAWSTSTAGLVQRRLREDSATVRRALSPRRA